MGATGLDWDAISTRYRERLAQEAEQGLDPVELRAPAPAPRPSRAKPGGKERQAATQFAKGYTPANTVTTAEAAEFVRLHTDGMTIAAIARQTGRDRETVSKYVGLAGQHGKTGRPRSATCGKGLHDMDTHGRADKRGGRYCAACKADRQRAYDAAKAAEKKATAAATVTPIRRAA